LVSIQGKAQIVFADTKGLVGLSIADGKVLWERPNPDPAAIPYIQPHPLEDGVLVVASGLGLGQIRLREKDGAWSVEELWTTKKFRPSFNDFVIRGAHVYGLDEGVLSCVDLKTGERVWKSGRYGSGQLALLAEQGWLLIVSEKGELALVEAKPEEPGEVFRFPAITGKTWNHPTIVQDCVYLRNGEEMACYRLPGFQKP
jgi:outer membrane protein assembly factor BamB